MSRKENIDVDASESPNRQGSPTETTHPVTGVSPLGGATRRVREHFLPGITSEENFDLPRT